MGKSESKGGQIAAMRPLLTVNDCAERLSLHANKVRELIRKGEIDAVRIPGGKGVFRITEAALGIFIERNTLTS